MPAIKLTGFQGEQPRIIPRLLPETGAQAAVNVRLDDGGLTPIRMAVQSAEALGEGHQTIYRHNGDWLSWDGIVNAAPGPVADDRLYYTGDGAPKVLIEGTVYPLAVPRPETALTASVSGSGTGDVTTRTYVYTWVTEFGEESEPNPASSPVDWQNGQTLTLTGFDTPPAGRAIDRQRIYRSQTGQSGTFLYLIEERAASSADFTDTVPVDQFQEPLPSGAWNAPPDELGGLVAMPNGMMAGFVGRRLYFCEPYRPHAWPETYALTTDADIVALGAIGTSLIVTTKRNPYLVSGATPSSMQMVKLELNLPCINPRSLVDMGFAICYASHEGLVAARADGQIGIVSGNLFNRDEWLRLSPSTFVAGQHSGRYVFWYDTLTVEGDILAGAVMVDIGEAPFLMRTNGVAVAAFYDPADGGLYYLPQEGTDIYRLDSPDGQRTEMYWRSKQFVLPYPENFGAILIDADARLSGQEKANNEAAIAATTAQNAAKIAAGSILGEMNAAPINARVAFAGDTLAALPNIAGVVQVGLYADGKRVVQVDRTNAPVRLPGGFKARTWEIDVSGDLKVSQIVLGKTIADLQQTP